LARIGSARFRHDGETGRQLAFSPDGRQTASVSTRGIHVFDVANGRLLHQVLVPSNRAVHVIRFIGDGKQLVIASGGGAGSTDPLDVLTYDFAESKVIRRTPVPGEHRHCLDFTTDGAGALIHGSDWKVYLWDLETGRKRWTIDLPDQASVWPADGQQFVIARGNGTEVRDVATGKVVTTLPTPDAKPIEGTDISQTLNVAHARDGKTAFCFSQSRKVIVRDKSGDVSDYDIPPPGRDSFRSKVFGERYFLRFSPDARYLLCSDNAPRDTNGTHIWDLSKPDNRQPIASLPGSNCATFSPDGKWLALDISGVITLWRTSDWKPLFEPISGAFELRDVFFSPDGSTVFGRSEFGWSAWPAGGGPGRLLMAEKQEYFSWQLSANGLVAVGILTTGGDLLIDHLATGRKVQIPLTECEQCPWVELSPDGRYVKVEVSDRRSTKQFIVYDTHTGTVRSRQRATPGTYFIQGDIAPTGAGLIRSLSGNFSGNVVVKDYARGGHWALPAAHGLSGAKFSRDGTRLVLETVSPEREHALEAWDSVLGRRIGALGKATCFKQRIAISADGRTILSGDYDGAVRVFEVASCAERMAFQHDREIRCVALDERGTRAIASSDDAPAYVWDLIGNPSQWDSSKATEVWNDLASADAKRAYRSITLLRVNPREAIDFLKSRVKIATVPSLDTVAAMLRRLDTPAFRDRESAQNELSSIAELIRPHLSAAQKASSEEASSRLARVLESTQSLTPERLRQVRACEVLESIGSREAVDLLRRWATGPDGSRLTVEAKQSLARLSTFQRFTPRS
jgi:WD40 repeat protein